MYNADIMNLSSRKVVINKDPTLRQVQISNVPFINLPLKAVRHDSISRAIPLTEHIVISYPFVSPGEGTDWDKSNESREVVRDRKR